jgi:Mg/Co/Ni transporter MgtE
MGAEEATALGEILKVATAMTPLLVLLCVSENRTQVVLPVMLEQVTLLPAAVAAEPATTLTLATTEEE